MAKKNIGQAEPVAQESVVDQNPESLTDTPPVDLPEEAQGAVEPPAQEPVVDQNPPPSGKKVMRIKNASCAGLSIFSASGKPCVFDAEGVAEVGVDDYAHFLKVPGYEPV